MIKKLLSINKMVSVSKTHKEPKLKRTYLGVAMTCSGTSLTQGYSGKIHEQFDWIHAKLGT